MRDKIIAGNWKMHGDRVSLGRLLDDVVSALPERLPCRCMVFPPYIYLPDVAAKLQHTAMAWGAQNLSAYEPGAYTGEIAATMLRDYGCQYALVGHSERRALYHEDNACVAMKFVQARQHDLTPILCVGETLSQRRDGLTEQVIAEQIEAVLQCGAGVENFAQAVIAYEPVWAIGTGESATPAQAQSIHAFIRARIATLDSGVAQQLPIIYGGSVKASNAKALFAMPDIDGALVGGASLDADQFVEIIQCIN